MTEKLTDEQVHDGAEYPASLHRREWQQLARELLAARERIAELEQERDQARADAVAYRYGLPEDPDEWNAVARRVSGYAAAARKHITELERELDQARADAMTALEALHRPGFALPHGTARRIEQYDQGELGALKREVEVLRARVDAQCPWRSHHEQYGDDCSQCAKQDEAAGALEAHDREAGRKELG